ncbi:MAG: biopolymer transporter ExbD [Bacteroidales bacterium]|nr:biopolymer transporter ExbD [Bacteroidales bacterium]MCL2133210.1 biopolymer transporter ExbD [Bacteroidales bacterium]
MAKFARKGKGGLPRINTASLPDVVFMLLFFFMTVTTFRETEQIVTVKVPDATEAVKIDRKELTCYIYVGVPVQQLQGQYGTDSRIQLNDKICTIDEIRDFIASERESKSEADRQLMTTSLKVDRDVRMGIVTDIKQELRRCSALKISYSSMIPL